jgi:hypothetical protein
MASSSVSITPPPVPVAGFVFDYEGSKVFQEQDLIAPPNDDDGRVIRFLFSSTKKSEAFANNDEMGKFYIYIIKIACK